MSIDKEFAKRINLVIDRHCGGNVSKFAESVSVKRSGMSKISRGEAMPSFATIQEILRVYPDTDARWFVIGIESKDHNKSSVANEDSASYGNDNWHSLFREQLQEKDKQISELLSRIPK